MARCYKEEFQHLLKLLAIWVKSKVSECVIADHVMKT